MKKRSLAPRGLELALSEQQAAERILHELQVVVLEQRIQEARAKAGVAPATFGRLDNPNPCCMMSPMNNAPVV